MLDGRPVLVLEDDIVMIGKIVPPRVEASGKGDLRSLQAGEPALGEFVTLGLDQGGHMHSVIWRDSYKAGVKSLVIKSVQQQAVLRVGALGGRSTAPKGLDVAGDQHGGESHARYAACVLIGGKDGGPKEVPLTTDFVPVCQRGKGLCSVDGIRVEQGEAR